MGLGLALVGLQATPALGDEIFYCADGKMVRVTSANRVAMREHPCVKAWFAGSRSQQTSSGRGNAGLQPASAEAGTAAAPAVPAVVQAEAGPAKSASPVTAQAAPSGKPTGTDRDAEPSPSGLIILNAERK